ncbi:hypothetical protein [Novosphingobium sp. FKTRR1]|nr:hypothetical protein [Novosphingobium sp. FKTRR1]
MIRPTRSIGNHLVRIIGAFALLLPATACSPLTADAHDYTPHYQPPLA